MGDLGHQTYTYRLEYGRIGIGFEYRSVGVETGSSLSSCGGGRRRLNTRSGCIGACSGLCGGTRRRSGFPCLILIEWWNGLDIDRPLWFLRYPVGGRCWLYS